MADVSPLSTEDRVAIDRVFERLSGRSHYEVLAISAESSWEEIDHALRDLRRRMDSGRFVGVPSDEYVRRIEHILRALDQASDVLSDPVRRFLYDQQLRRGEGRRGETPIATRPATTPVPPRPFGASARAQGVPPGGERTSVAPEPMAPPPSSASPLVVPAPYRKDTVVPPGSVRTPSPRSVGSRPSFVAPPLDGASRTAGGPTGATATSHDRQDLDTLLVEVERIAVSVQFCIAQLLDPQGGRVLALQSAGQALAETRGTLAGLQARRDEEAGRWSDAAVNWHRASRAKPQDAALLTREAECQHRLGDLPAAEDAARRALAIDPGFAAALALLTSLSRR